MGLYQPLGGQSVEESFPAVASYDIAVPAGWKVFRAIWSLLPSAGGDLTARASGGATTRQVDHAYNSAASHVVTSGRISYSPASVRLSVVAIHDMTASHMVQHGSSAFDDGGVGESIHAAFHSSVPTSIGVAVSAGTMTGTVRLERIR